MVDLPRYVKAQRKPNGRVFYYYERYRGTPRAWPRIALPSFETSPAEAFARAELCLELDVEHAGEAWCFRWPGAEGRRYDLPDPKGGPSFWQAVDQAIEAERDAAAGEGKTFRALIALYKGSDSYSALAVSTKGDYDRYLDVVLETWGDDRVADLTTPDAQAAVDSYAGAPASGRFFRAVLARLIAYGIPRGFSTANPAEHTEKPGGKPVPNEPWPEWALEILFEHARPSLRLPALSALYTGQRKVDVIGMMKPSAEATEMPLVARTTGTLVPVQLHSGYRRAIDLAHPAPAGSVVALREEPVSLHLREDRTAWTYEGFSTAWQRDMTWGVDPDKPNRTLLRQAERERDIDPAKVAAMAGLREAKLVFHGFRKNAVNMLLECGSTEAEVSAIVEMSEQMVRHYAQAVDKRRLAIAAMKKLEAAWGGVRGPRGT